MDSNSFEKINLCHITPRNEYEQMLNKTALTDRQKYSLLYVN